jgi:predicted nucleic acid-binding protein
MAALRCLIDSMVFDAIAAEPQLLSEVDRLTSARRIELLAAAETMAEVAATPDPAHRRRLQRVRVLVVPPVDPADAATAGRLNRLRAAPGVSDEDARIALAAVSHAIPLVTEDRDLRLAARERLPHLMTWTWADDLRPRLLTLMEEHPLSVARSGRHSHVTGR